MPVNPILRLCSTTIVRNRASWSAFVLHVGVEQRLVALCADPQRHRPLAPRVGASPPARLAHLGGGANYVLWGGGAEGYETLLNTDMKREADQLARFLTMVVEHKRKIGFNGTLLIEPKPQEPTKHQYDYDSATVHGFLARYRLESELKVNIEDQPATLAGHSFQHEVAYAVGTGIFGSVNANRGDPQNGWDTDQFPNSVDELSLVLLRDPSRRCFENGGFNFDTKLRRQSLTAATCSTVTSAASTPWPGAAHGPRRARRRHARPNRSDRYAGWGTDRGRAILDGSLDLAALADAAVADELDPRPVSGKQERLENHVNRVIWSTP